MVRGLACRPACAGTWVLRAEPGGRRQAGEPGGRPFRPHPPTPPRAPQPNPRAAGPPSSLYNFHTWSAQVRAFLSEVVGGPATLCCNSVGGIAGLQARREPAALGGCTRMPARAWARARMRDGACPRSWGAECGAWRRRPAGSWAPTVLSSPAWLLMRHPALAPPSTSRSGGLGRRRPGARRSDPQHLAAHAARLQAARLAAAAGGGPAARPARDAAGRLVLRPDRQHQGGCWSLR